jgi:thiol-disulfide isomerase/thioredoxin
MKVTAAVLIMIAGFSFPVQAEDPPKKKGVPKAEEKSEMVKRAESFTHTNDYVHRWIKFPSGSGKSIAGGENTLKARNGYVTVVFFVASWDVKSQELMKRFQKLESTYKNLATNFVYVFTHDTFEDAVAFAEDSGVTNGLVAGHELHKNFHHPKIPSIYIGDKDGWLAGRYLDTNPADIESLDEYLRYVTSI